MKSSYDEVFAVIVEHRRNERDRYGALTIAHLGSTAKKDFYFLLILLVSLAAMMTLSHGFTAISFKLVLRRIL